MTCQSFWELFKTRNDVEFLFRKRSSGSWWEKKFLGQEVTCQSSEIYPSHMMTLSAFADDIGQGHDGQRARKGDGWRVKAFSQQPSASRGRTMAFRYSSCFVPISRNSNGSCHAILSRCFDSDWSRLDMYTWITISIFEAAILLKDKKLCYRSCTSLISIQREVA